MQLENLDVLEKLGL